MQVAFKDNTPARDVPQLFYQLRKKISDIKDDLPAGLIGPSVNDEYGDVNSILYMITSDGADYAQMKKVAEAFRQRLLKVKNVTKVNLYGTQDEQIFVEFSDAKLATLGITTDQLFQSLARQNAVVPAGVLETTAQRVPLRVTGALDGAKAVAETPVEANGRVFRMGDIATVTHGFVDPPDFMVRQRGKSAIGVGIVMAKGANILELGPAVAAATADFTSAVPQGFDFEQIADQPAVVDHAVGEFVRSFIEALAIVLFVSFLALGWRTGFVVALSVPLVLAVVFVVMNAIGLDLHRITLGALIIALGLLVDDAIIAVEMMVVKMEQGWDRIRAASFAWESTAFPMLTGTLVTAVGFLPIGFANSSVGEYAGGIFWVVANCAFGVVGGGGRIHPLPRREVAAERQAARSWPQSPRDLRNADLSRFAPRHRVVRQAARHGRARDRRDLSAVNPGLRPRAAAILPAVRAAGTVLPAPHARGHGVRYDVGIR